MNLALGSRATRRAVVVVEATQNRIAQNNVNVAKLVSCSVKTATAAAAAAAAAATTTITTTATSTSTANAKHTIRYAQVVQPTRVERCGQGLSTPQGRGVPTTVCPQALLVAARCWRTGGEKLRAQDDDKCPGEWGVFLLGTALGDQKKSQGRRDLGT
jgi:hypothetical protein